MNKEKFDFYDSTSIKVYNLDKKLRYELAILDNLDPITKRHSINVGNLCGRICQYLRLNKNLLFMQLSVVICMILEKLKFQLK